MRTTLVCLVAGAVAASSARGGTVLLLGDSLLDCHRGNDRIERPMTEKLNTLRQGERWEVVNLARGGMWIGPADASKVGGVSKPLFDSPTSGWYFEVLKRCPRADAVVVEFAGNDSKVYPPKAFGEKLAALCDRLARDYSRAKVFLATGMYLDPAHSGRYWRNPSMVEGWKQGGSRNDYLRPYYEETPALARRRGLGLADMCERIKAETESGNWDLRMRRDGTLDTSKDAEHANDAGWFGNIHPNLRGTEVMADALAKTLLGMDAVLPYAKAERR